MTVRSLTLVVLLVATAVACSPRSRGLTPKKANAVKALADTHKADECPEFNGTFVNSGVEWTFKTFKIENGVVYDMSYVHNGKTESDAWAADAQLVEFGENESYQAVCSKNVVVKYSSKDKKQTREVSLTLTEKGELKEVLNGETFIWTKKEVKAELKK